MNLLREIYFNKKFCAKIDFTIENNVLLFI